MKGKEKCKALKEIRKQIADENDIPFVVSQCTHKGECKGTCPKCEAELKYLERELAIKQELGKAVAIVGISLGVCSTLTACSPIQSATNFINSMIHEDDLEGMPTDVPEEGHMVCYDDLEGDVAMPEDTDETYPEDDSISE